MLYAVLSGNYGLKVQQQCKNYPYCCNHIQKIS